MSEEKVIQHAKKAIEIVHEKASFKQKAKEFLGEIVIIIIAVSITLAFHNWNEDRHESKIARNFLKGVSADLKNSAAGLSRGVKAFQPTVDYYDNVWKQIQSKHINSRYIDSLSAFMRNTSYFTFDNSRFEGFKSSGYLRLIENDVLLKHIVTLYTILMPFEKDADATFFNRRAEDFDRYIGTSADIDASGNILISKLLDQKPVRYQFFLYGEILDERQAHKKDLAKRMVEMADEIDKELEK